MIAPDFEEIIQLNDQVEARLRHLEKLKESLKITYPNRWQRTSITGEEDTISSILGSQNILQILKPITEFKEKSPSERPPNEIKEEVNNKLKEIGTFSTAGRMAVPPRLMGKAAFVHISDGKSRLQIYFRKGDFHFVREAGDNSIAKDESWELFQLLDHGDFIGVTGYLFVTNTGELSIHCECVSLLSKALHPMPDKMHGVSDPEVRQRRRYVDLIASSLQVEHEGLTTREVFERRAKLISATRAFLEKHGYIEVETPMLTPKATGAAARPFITHHNALGIDLYARIAPELYLKRLLVGGFEKVFELNRNFRNEGISFKHNPEFTMLEFYCAYLDANGMMNFCEKLLKEVILSSAGQLVLDYQGKQIDFEKFERITMKDAVVKFGGPEDAEGEQLEEAFEKFVEPNLTNPTFIIGYPKAISPLSKASPDDPLTAERFELFVAGMEVANGFSELNDPLEQYQRFMDQMKKREGGDEEAMVMDEDYILALAYGMPPAAGIGIGIDRLAMLVTNRHSIRDVILF
ncbi:MAG TPA: lysine--tRNA ligase, partial [Pyrinomonadaceae bacterium]|nr:lysine--tRNA ligase [Pyrinomonadaceae bacterium]